MRTQPNLLALVALTVACASPPGDDATPMGPPSVDHEDGLADPVDETAPDADPEPETDGDAETDSDSDCESEHSVNHYRLLEIDDSEDTNDGITSMRQCEESLPDGSEPDVNLTGD